MLNTLYVQHFDRMTAVDFALMKSAYLERLQEKTKSLDESYIRNFGQITSQTYNFNRKQQRVKMVQSLTVDVVKDFYRELLLRKRRFIIKLKN